MTEDTILDEFNKVMEFMASKPRPTYEEVMEHRRIICESMSTSLSSLPSGVVTTSPNVKLNLEHLRSASFGGQFREV